LQDKSQDMQRKVFLFLFQFLLVNLLMTTSFAQESLLDTAAATDLSTDTLTDSRSLVYNHYLLPDPNRKSLFLNSIREKVTVKNGDFVAAIDVHNELVKQRLGVIDNTKAKFYRPLWVLFLVLGLFLMLAVVKIVFPVDFSMIAQAFYKDRLLMQISKDDNMANSWSYILLYLIFSATLSLFILITEAGFTNINMLSPVNYLKLAGLVTVLFILKILAIRFIAFVFLINRIVREYIAVIYLIYFNSLFVLMPLLIIVTLIPETYFKTVLILFSVIMSIMFIYRFIRTAINFVGNSKFSIFYLFLYLCSLEVAPILILVKTLSN